MQGQSQSRDTTFVGPGVANTIRECDGKVDMMSFWTFSDVFEEGGPAPRPFEGQFGLRAEFGINKPSFYDFALLHKLGDKRIANESKDVIVTKATDGAVVIAAWNIVDPAENGKPDATLTASAKAIKISVKGVAGDAAYTVERVDNEHGNVLPIYKAMGSPLNPTPGQVEEMNKKTALGAPETGRLKGGSLELNLEPNALVVVRVK